MYSSSLIRTSFSEGQFLPNFCFKNTVHILRWLHFCFLVVSNKYKNKFEKISMNYSSCEFTVYI